MVTPAGTLTWGLRASHSYEESKADANQRPDTARIVNEGEFSWIGTPSIACALYFQQETEVGCLRGDGQAAAILWIFCLPAPEDRQNFSYITRLDFLMTRLLGQGELREGQWLKARLGLEFYARITAVRLRSAACSPLLKLSSVQ